jgi:hypothetical protein
MVSVAACIDTSVIIDLSRQYLPAKQWMLTQVPAEIGISPAAWMEIMFGALNKTNQQKAQKLVSHFTLQYPTDADHDWAMRQIMKYGISHNVGVIDCLIAAPAYRLQLPLYTTNLKHFKPLLGALAVRPY